MYHGHKFSGLFISFEGGEGAGKGTLLKLLKEDFDRANLKYEFSFEPGADEDSTRKGDDTRRLIRKILLDKQYFKTIFAELGLYSADRSIHVENRIKPGLERGYIEVTDRFLDSSRAYQGYAGEMNKTNLDFVEKSQELATQNIRPDITFYLDITPDIGLERATRSKKEFENGDWQESKGLSFHERVRQGYLDLARREPERFRIINTRKKPEECYAELKSHLNPLLKEKYGKNI
jgi:dTMP kinase